MNEKLRELFDEFDQRTAMPRDKGFLDALDYGHMEPSDLVNLHTLKATHPDHGDVGSIEWDPVSKRVEGIYVEPKHRHKGLGTNLWERAHDYEPDIKHSFEMTPQGRDWATSLGPEDAAHAQQVDEIAKSASQTRTCVMCKKIFDVSQNGEATGFCGDCREKEGLVTHNSWSEDAQDGHYGAIESPPHPEGEAGIGQLYGFCSDCFGDTPEADGDKCGNCDSTKPLVWHWQHPEDGEGTSEWAQWKQGLPYNKDVTYLPEEGPGVKAKTAASYVALYPESTRDNENYFTIHVNGCQAAEREHMQRGGSQEVFEHDDPKTVARAALDLDPDLEDMGYAPDSYKVHDCVRKGLAPQKPRDPDACPGWGMPIKNPTRRLYLPCPECGKSLGTGRGVYPKHKPRTSATVPNQNKRAIMAIGIPGSGKSTLLKPYAEALGAAYVSSDETRGEVTGDPGDVSRDAEVWPLIYDKLHQALETNDTVVFDSTASNFEKRRDIIRHLRQKAGTVEGIHFDIPLDVAHQRNEMRDRQVPPSIIDAMHKQLQDNPPGDEFDSVQVVGNATDSGEDTLPDRGVTSARLAAKKEFMRSPEASFKECRFCLGSGINGGRRCGKCAASGSEGTVPCRACGEELRAFETFQRRTAGRIVPVCARCAQLQTDVLERLTEEARPKEMGGQEGFSRSIRNTKPSDGYMVSDAGSEKRHDFDIERPHLAVPHLEGFIRQNNGLLTRKNKYFGGWLDSKGKLCLDVSENYKCAHGHEGRLCDDRKRAYIAGITNHQEMIFHVNAPEDDQYLDPRKHGLEDFPELEEFVSNYDRQRKSSVEEGSEKPDKHFIRIEKDNGDLDVDAMVESMMDHLFPDGHDKP